jgi:purine nucleosidase
MPPLIDLDIMFWWDALAAGSLVQGDDDGLVGYRMRKVDVVLDGPSSGRTVDAVDGTPQLVGHTADGAGFEDGFLTILNGSRLTSSGRTGTPVPWSWRPGP